MLGELIKGFSRDNGLKEEYTSFSTLIEGKEIMVFVIDYQLARFGNLTFQEQVELLWKRRQSLLLV